MHFLLPQGGFFVYLERINVHFQSSAMKCVLSEVFAVGPLLSWNSWFMFTCVPCMQTEEG